MFGGGRVLGEFSGMKATGNQICYLLSIIDNVKINQKFLGLSDGIRYAISIIGDLNQTQYALY